MSYLKIVAASVGDYLMPIVALRGRFCWGCLTIGNNEGSSGGRQELTGCWQQDLSGCMIEVEARLHVGNLRSRGSNYLREIPVSVIEEGTIFNCQILISWWAEMQTSA